MEISATLSSPVPAEELGSGGSRPNTTVGQLSAMAPIKSGRHLPQRARGKQSSGMAHRESNLHLQQHPSNLTKFTFNQCPLCVSKFKIKSDLKIHIKTIHNQLSLCFALMWTLKSDSILNLDTHRGHWLNVTFVTKA